MMPSTIEWTPTAAQVPAAAEQLSIGLVGRIKQTLGRDVHIRLSRCQKEAIRRGYIPRAPSVAQGGARFTDHLGVGRIA